MFEIEPRSYLESVVNGKFKKGEPYVWHDNRIRENAIEKAKGAVLSEYNGWPAQTEKLKRDILGLVVQDRSMAITDFINSIGGRAKLFAVVSDLKLRVVRSAHDWILKPVNSHEGLVPSKVGLMAAKLRQNGFSFDDYLVAEPVAKPALPRPADPVLVGALGSPVGFYLVEVGRWEGIIRGNDLRYNVELGNIYEEKKAETNERWPFVVVSALIGLILLVAIKGFWGFVIGTAIASGFYKFLKSADRRMNR